MQTKLAAKNDALDWLVANEKARNIRKKAMEEQKQKELEKKKEE